MGNGRPMCNDRGVTRRSLAVLVLCLAFLGTRVAGLHFHFSEHHEHSPAVTALHAEPAGHADSHLTSDFAIGHFDDHASNQEFDAGDADGLLAKLPVTSLPVLFVMLWLASVLVSRMAAGRFVPIECLRPPPLKRWPTLLLPPSQGPPRAA
jgi:hypothetical protein